MKIHELSPAPGSKKSVKRIGRGPASGQGKTAGKGHKGQKARAGRGMNPGFEGGQMPLQRRLPKRGFNNIFAKTYVVINLDDLSKFDADSVVDITAVREAGYGPRINDGLKIIGSGSIDKALTVKVNKITNGAKEKIEAAGGKVEVI